MKHRTLSAVVLALAATAPGLIAQNTAIFDRVGNDNHIVGYYDKQIDKNNSFQMLLIDRSSDFNAGDFDVEFNYNQIQWETGDASKGSGGFGGDPARVGLANGSGRYLEYAGSGVSLAFLDRKPEATAPNCLQGLRYQMLNSTVPGRLVIPIRGGVPELPGEDFQIDAGSNQWLGFNGGSSFTLQGAVSPYDITGVTYLWEQIRTDTEPKAEIVSPNSITTMVNIPEPGDYFFRLTGTRQGIFNLSLSDIVTITHPGEFLVAGGTYLLAFGDPLSQVLHSAQATFNGQNVTNFEWKVLGDSGAVILNPTAIRPTVSLPGPGTYQFEIAATTSTYPPFAKKAIATVILPES